MECNVEHFAVLPLQGIRGQDKLLIHDLFGVLIDMIIK
jgi:hypothetical protein